MLKIYALRGKGRFLALFIKEFIDTMNSRYQPSLIEPKWQKFWEEQGIFQVETYPGKKKYYLLEMFPYPSGRIHMGHLRVYSIGDVITRYKVMRGFNVLHPMGWDAFGLPAENAAIEQKVHPAEWTYQNIDYWRGELKRLGYSYDWRREFATCDPSYYKWEQLIFLKMLEKGLVYKARSYVNWCDRCDTVLANEQVENGYCWRHPDTLVRQKELSQWYFKITDYAEELLEWTDKLTGWPEKVLVMQRNWIGKSRGAYIQFPLEKTYTDPNTKESIGRIEVYTTRQDTLYGATFMSLAAEHPLCEILSRGTEQESAVRELCERVRSEDRIKRSAEDYKKEGVFTGAYCTNPMTGKRMPVYVANFVLMDYGTGSVMAVPTHDQRDFEFAKEYGLELIPVVQPVGEPELKSETMTEAYTGEGIMINSGDYNGMKSEEFRRVIADYLAEHDLGGPAINYRIRDWLISRQRYWGAPIPIIYCDKCGIVPVAEKDLPVKLPTDIPIDFSKGNPLARAESWLKTTCPNCKGPARRETDTMDTFVESSWYFDRYASPVCDTAPFDEKDVDYWLPVDQYVGGIEHAVMHLLYSRFYTKVLRDLGYLKHDEPFTNLLTQGMVIKETLFCPGHGELKPADITEDHTCRFCGAPVGERQEEGKPPIKVCKGHGYFFPNEVKDGKCPVCGLPIVAGRKEKMSKSKKNVVEPGEMIEKYGADTVRLFGLFASPPEKEIDWSDEGVQGCYRFLNRVWTLAARYMDRIKGIQAPENRSYDYLSGHPDEAALYRKIHQTIRDVGDRIDRFLFNTAIAAMMELYNTLAGFDPDKGDNPDARLALMRDGIETLITLLNPFTPHLSEEIWHELGRTESTFRLLWPEHDPRALEMEEFELVIQVNGKVRAKIAVPTSAGKEDLKKLALAHERIQAYTEGKEIKKIIVVPNRLVNIVV